MAMHDIGANRTYQSYQRPESPDLRYGRERACHRQRVDREAIVPDDGEMRSLCTSALNMMPCVAKRLHKRMEELPHGEINVGDLKNAQGVSTLLRCAIDPAPPEPS